MKLVEGWEKSYKWFSVQVAALAGIIPFVWDILPQETKDIIPEGWNTYILTAVGVAVVVGRLIDQE